MPIGPGSTPVVNPDDSTATGGGVGRSQVVYLTDTQQIGPTWPQYTPISFAVRVITETTTMYELPPMVVRANATSGAMTITLPASSATAGGIYHISKIDNSANAVTIAVDASDAWYGATAAQTLASQWKSVTLVSVFDSVSTIAGWHVIATT